MEFFKIWHKESCREVHRHYINSFFSKKVLAWSKWVIVGPKNAAPSYFIKGMISNFDFWNVGKHE